MREVAGHGPRGQRAVKANCAAGMDITSRLHGERRCSHESSCRGNGEPGSSTSARGIFSGKSSRAISRRRARGLAQIPVITTRSRRPPPQHQCATWSDRNSSASFTRQIRRMGGCRRRSAAVHSSMNDEDRGSADPIGARLRPKSQRPASHGGVLNPSARDAVRTPRVRGVVWANRTCD